MPTPIQNSCGTNPDICQKYQDGLDAGVKKNTEAARQAWQDVDDAAKKGGISNRWSQQAREELAREFPDQFKALHQEIVQGTDAP